MNELDWAVALQQLIELLQDALKQTNKKIRKLIQSQLEQWISGLPSNIKAYLPIYSAKVEKVIIVPIFQVDCSINTPHFKISLFWINRIALSS